MAHANTKVHHNMDCYLLHQIVLFPEPDQLKRNLCFLYDIFCTLLIRCLFFYLKNLSGPDRMIILPSGINLMSYSFVTPKVAICRHYNHFDLKYNLLTIFLGEYYGCKKRIGCNYISIYARVE